MEEEAEEAEEAVEVAVLVQLVALSSKAVQQQLLALALMPLCSQARARTLVQALVRTRSSEKLTPQELQRWNLVTTGCLVLALLTGSCRPV